MVDGRAAGYSPTVTVIGEALVDLVAAGKRGDFHASPGGSPFNVAIGLARLGHRTSLMARLSDTAFGGILRDHAAAEGIDLTAAPHAIEATTLAVVSMDADAQASYDFYVDGTADWQWTAAETARVPVETALLHFGSIASWTAPGDEHILAIVTELHRRGRVLVSYDPNVRPKLLGDPARARRLIEQCVAVAHVVKASREDVQWLYPGMSIEQVSTHWAGLGAALVLVTDGADGAHAFRAGCAPIARPGRRVDVVDTVGAGDAFTAGLLSAFLRRGVLTPEHLARCTAETVGAAVDDAVLVSALTCRRVGADPPRALARSTDRAGAPLSVQDLRFADRS